MNWCGLLAEALFEEFGNGLCTLINSGKSASTFAEARIRLQRDVLRFEPDAVILALGMNDALRGDAGLPAFRDDVRQTIAQIQNAGAEILIRTPNPVIASHGLPLPQGVEVGRPAEFGARKLREYSHTLVALAHELSIPVVDHYSLWTAKRVAFKHPVCNPQELWPLMSDSIHPGALGHMRFFRELAPSLGLSRYFPWEDVTC